MRCRMFDCGLTGVEKDGFPGRKKRRVGYIKNEAQVCRICFFSYICDYINKIVSYGLRP